MAAKQPHLATLNADPSAMDVHDLISLYVAESAVQSSNMATKRFNLDRPTRKAAYIRKSVERRQNDQSHGGKQATGIPTLSLFSGAGGLDLGFLQADYDIRACVEIEPNYCTTLRANVGSNHRFGSEVDVHEIEIRKFDASRYREAGIRCVIGGPPCQTFSAAGRRAGGVIGTSDERGQLFQAYCKVLDSVNPEVFVFENVYGLPGANGGKPFAEICDAFSQRGYILSWEVVDAAD